MLSLLCLLLICFTVSQCWFHQTPDQILHQNLFCCCFRNFILYEYFWQEVTNDCRLKQTFTRALPFSEKRKQNWQLWLVKRLKFDFPLFTTSFIRLNILLSIFVYTDNIRCNFLLMCTCCNRILKYLFFLNIW